MAAVVGLLLAIGLFGILRLSRVSEPGVQTGNAFAQEDGTRWTFFAPLGGQIEFGPIDLEDEWSHAVTVTREVPVITRGRTRYRIERQFLTSLQMGPYRVAEVAITPAQFLLFYGNVTPARPIVYHPCPNASCLVKRGGRWENASSEAYMETQFVATQFGYDVFSGFEVFYTSQGERYKEFVPAGYDIHVVTHAQYEWGLRHGRIATF